MASAQSAWFDAHLLRAHPLWMMPDWAIEADPPLRLDARDWMTRCAEAGIQSLLFVTKHHDGRCVWPTKLDAPRINHGYTGDFMGDICAEARRAEISIVAYYSAAIDTAQAIRHPDWRFIDAEGIPSHAYGYIWVCLNSPYGEFALGQIEEIVANYDVPCVWLDIFALGRPGKDCLCEYCQRKYAKRSGGDLRSITGTSAMGRWKIDCLEEYLAKVRALMDRYRPGALLSFNGAGPGFRRHPEAGVEGRRLLRYVDFCSDEGHYPARESSYARYLRSLGKPFEILAANGAGNQWVNFAVKPSTLLTLDAAVVCAHGGKFGTGISVLANGALPPGEMDEIAKTGTWLQQRRDYLTGQIPLSDAAILCQPYRIGQFERPYRPPEAPDPAPLPEGALSRYRPPAANVLTNGLEVALVEAHVQFDLIDEDHPLESPNGRYQLLVLPGNAIITSALAERIRSFVEAGGSLLAEGHAGLLDEQRRRHDDFVLADVLGVHFDGYTGAWDATYLHLDDDRLKVGLPQGPVLIDGPAVKLRLDGAEPLALVGIPIGGERTPEHHVGGRVNPPGVPSRHAAITLHRYGRGLAIYVAASVGDAIAGWRSVDPWPKQLVAHLVELLLPKPLLSTNAPSGVEVLLARQNARHLIYLFNHYLTYESVSARRDAPQTSGVEVTFNEARLGPIWTARVVPEGLSVQLRREAERVTLTVPPFALATILTIEGRIADHLGV